jgi:galactonate dehydratase
MRINEIQAYPLRIPRDLDAALGTAGSPAPLEQRPGEARYRRAVSYPTVYATALETTIVRLVTNDGFVGWGEAQAPVVPEASAAVINVLLAPLLKGEDPSDPERLWDLMYDAMRVRGHHGGLYLDAMAGVDLAVWDVCGQAAQRPVSALLAGVVRRTIPLYISGLAGTSIQDKVAYAAGHAREGARAFKLFLDADEARLLETIDALRASLDPVPALFVDALWRLTLEHARHLVGALAEREIAWLEAPLEPEDLDGHRALAEGSAVPIALGEALRTTFEVKPWLEAKAVRVLQPDLGRTGLTGALRIARLASVYGVPLSPHVSVGFGPQIAAAAHFAAATPDVAWVECNPLVYDTANQFLTTPLVFDAAGIVPSAAPGLGATLSTERFERYSLVPPQESVS